jgi:hypothetical protein
MVIAIIINIARKQTIEQNKQTSQKRTRKGRKEATAEERIQKANGGGYGSSGGRKMEMEAVEVGGCN